MSLLNVGVNVVYLVVSYNRNKNNFGWILSVPLHKKCSAWDEIFVQDGFSFWKHSVLPNVVKTLT